MLRFTTIAGETVYVNPARVLYVKERDANSCSICVGAPAYLHVKGDALNAALKIETESEQRK